LATRARLSEAENAEFMVYRFDPLKDKRHYYVIYEVPFRRGMTVLEGLQYITDELDPTLSLRFSCRFKVCGSCAMMINGLQRLACETQVSNLGKRIKVEPLAHFKVIKDLVVDLELFLEKMTVVKPWISPRNWLEPPRVTPTELARYLSASDCIWCGACMSACPIVGTEPYYLGPAPLAQLFRFNVDERELVEEKLLRLLVADSDLSGVWRCHQVFACTTVCPKKIDPGHHIAELKRMVVRNRFKGKI
jgi:succinate dehydrogenase / fumarate reductase iron-sulfur subunit